MSYSDLWSVQSHLEIGGGPTRYQQGLSLELFSWGDAVLAFCPRDPSLMLRRRQIVERGRSRDLLMVGKRSLFVWITSEGVQYSQCEQVGLALSKESDITSGNQSLQQNYFSKFEVNCFVGIEGVRDLAKCKGLRVSAGCSMQTLYIE